MFTCVFSLLVSSLFGQVYPGSMAAAPSLNAAVNLSVREAAQGGYLPHNSLIEAQFDELNFIGVINMWKQYGFVASNPGHNFVPTVAFVGPGVDCMSEKSLVKNKCDPRSRSFIFDDVYNDTSGADTLIASVFAGLNDGGILAGIADANILAVQVWKNRLTGGGVTQDYSPDNAELGFRFLLAQPDPFMVVHISLPLQSTPSLDAVIEEMRQSGRFYFVGAAYDQPGRNMSQSNAQPCSKKLAAQKCVASVSETGSFVPGGYGPTITGTSIGRFVWAQGLGGKFFQASGNHIAAGRFTALAALLWGNANALGRQLTSFEVDGVINRSLRFEAGLMNYVAQNQVGVPGVVDFCEAYKDLLEYLDGEPLPSDSEVSVTSPADQFLKPGVLRLTASGVTDQTQFRFNGLLLDWTKVDDSTVEVNLGDKVFDTYNGAGVLYTNQCYKGKPLASTVAYILAPAFLVP